MANVDTLRWKSDCAMYHTPLILSDILTLKKRGLFEISLTRLGIRFVLLPLFEVVTADTEPFEFRFSCPCAENQQWASLIACAMIVTILIAKGILGHTLNCRYLRKLG